MTAQSMTDTSKPLAGRAAIVTGSGRNLGRGMILSFAKAGANVVVNGHRDRDAIERVADEARALGVEALPVLADVSKPEECERLVAETVAAFGSADIAVANVGLRPRQAFMDITVEDWRHVIETNLSAAFYLARAVVPEMQKRRWGRIIHISGRDGFFTISHRAHNVTCKAGLHSLAKAIAVELGEFGITANTIAPGKMDTVRDEKHYPGYREAWAEAVKAMPLRRLGTAEDVGEACVYLATGGEYVTGQLLHLNGGEFVF